jgi:hypothetical protein
MALAKAKIALKQKKKLEHFSVFVGLNFAE